MQYEPCQLDVLINSCNQIYNEQLTVEFTGEPCVVSCKELLSVYFSELMSNTVKHGTPGYMTDKPALTACIQYHEANGSHHFMYCDNGIGIHTNDIDYVLQPLNTLGESHDDNASAGLGFSILLRIAELLYDLNSDKNKAITAVQVSNVISQVGFIEGEEESH